MKSGKARSETKVDLVEYGLMAGMIAMSAGAIMPELVAQATEAASHVTRFMLVAVSISSGS